MKVLSIETSCDETAVAIVGGDDCFDVLEHAVASQISTHQKFGGVVPEVAARMHVPVLPKMLEAMTDWNRDDIDAVVVTAGPGLSTALRVGIESAKALAASWKVPLIPVDHMEGHIYANFLGREVPDDMFPILCLVVSGGHTEIVLMKNHGEYEFLGQTRDDAAGEAFDKTAAQLGLSYPGGPSISKSALEGDPEAIDFPRPMLHSDNFDMSFSGLKTAVKNEIAKYDELDDKLVSNISASFQQAVVDVLVSKTLSAAEARSPKTVMLCGGVAANKELRTQLEAAFENTDIDVLVPDFKYATDNASMVGAAGLQALRSNKIDHPLYEIDADPAKVLGGKWKWEV